MALNQQDKIRIQEHRNDRESVLRGTALGHAMDLVRRQPGDGTAKDIVASAKVFADFLRGKK